jgi:hypothetical protein
VLRARIEGHTALAEPLGDGRWKVQLTSARLPQLIEVETRCGDGSDAGHGVVQLTRPKLLADAQPIPVGLSLWSLCSGQSSALPTVDGAKPVTGLEYAAWRLERLVNEAEAAMPTATQSPPEDGNGWLRPWADVLSAARREALLARGGSGRQEASAEVSPRTDEQLAAATARVDTWLAAANDVLAPGQTDGNQAALGSLLPLAAPNGSRWTYCVADGGIDHVTIAATAAGTSPGRVRLVGLAAIVVLAIVLAWLARFPAAHDLLWRWPHTAGLLMGLAAWACLQPSWLGLLIVATVLLLVVRPAWPGPTFRADESTVLQRVP